MQTFVVLLLGISLGWKLGLFTVVLYLVEGLAGLPVFLLELQKKVWAWSLFHWANYGIFNRFFSSSLLNWIFYLDNSFFKNFAKITILSKFHIPFRINSLGSLIGWDKPVFKLGAQPFLQSYSKFRFSLCSSLKY